MQLNAAETGLAKLQSDLDHARDSLASGKGEACPLVSVCTIVLLLGRLQWTSSARPAPTSLYPSSLCGLHISGLELRVHTVPVGDQCLAFVYLWPGTRACNSEVEVDVHHRGLSIWEESQSSSYVRIVSPYFAQLHGNSRPFLTQPSISYLIAEEREGLSAELHSSQQSIVQLPQDVSSLTAENSSLEGRLQDLEDNHRSLQ